ncbi:hypothetical protein JQ597_03165 [Bradyrhizobium sp. AUGA SZCCT0177]|uniref:hypothetical protein n=1 Tax=Bradyrhizobium sp. AUGA SZCCT0177 TaxID=2807665 RepID=UPI001BA461C7|nr:hypothetical protein [Bradyrhizobium sp. AUGA SZCCT0177]MBR1281033.1 hypothetical protein [Bradyrhizobium sp. AUGA SZCCT0177]
MESERYFSGEIVVVLADGSRRSARVTADEILEVDKEIYRVFFEQGAETKVAESEEDFFEALKNLRHDLEKTGALLHCFGASENVYPSGMQKSMGPAILAYRMHIGSPALRKDIVNIFDADQTVVPSTVEQQKQFHERWIKSLSGKA